jgi:hypothetical protein
MMHALVGIYLGGRRFRLITNPRLRLNSPSDQTVLITGYEGKLPSMFRNLVIGAVKGPLSRHPSARIASTAV